MMPHRPFAYADVGKLNLKTGISMPQLSERNGRSVVMYSINKEHIVPDEILTEQTRR